MSHEEALALAVTDGVDMSEDQRTHLKKALARLFHPCFDGSLDDPDLRNDLSGICLSQQTVLIPEAKISSFAEFRRHYSPAQDVLKRIFVPATSETPVGSFLAIERFGLFDARDMEISKAHLPRIRVSVGPTFPSLFFDQQGRIERDFDTRFAELLFDHLAADEPGEAERIGLQIFELFREVYQSIETHISRTDTAPFPPEFTQRFRAYVAAVCRQCGLNVEVLTAERVRRYIETHPGITCSQHPFFSGRAVICDASEPSQFLDGLDLNPSVGAIPASGTLPMDGPSEFVQALDTYRQGNPGQSAVDRLRDALANSFFQPKTILAQGELTSTLLALPDHDALLAALARDTQARMIGADGAIIALDDPVLRDPSVIAMLHPRVDGTAEPGRVLNARRIGLWHPDFGTVAPPEGDLCVLTAFPNHLASALKWVQRQGTQPESSIWDRLPHTRRFVDQVIWAASDFETCYPQKLPSDAPEFVESAREMLEEMGNSPEFSYPLERTITHILHAALPEAMLIPPDASADAPVSVAYLGSPEDSLEPSIENTWGDIANPECLWSLPGLVAGPDHPATVPKHRITSAARLHPFWVEAKNRVSQLEASQTRTQLQHDLRLGFEDLGHDLRPDKLGPFIATWVTALEDAELARASASACLEPTDLDRFLRRLDGDLFPKGTFRVWTRFDDESVLNEFSTGFRVHVTHDPHQKPGQWLGVLRRGIVTTQAETRVWKAPVLLKNEGPIDPCDLFLEELRGFLVEHDLIKPHQQRLLEALQTPASWDDEAELRVIKYALLAALFWSVLGQLAPDFRIQKIARLIQENRLPCFTVLLFSSMLTELKQAAQDRKSWIVHLEDETYRVDILRQDLFGQGERVTLNFWYPKETKGQKSLPGGFTNTHHFQANEVRALEQGLQVYFGTPAEPGG